MARLFNPFIAQKPEMGALPTLYAACASDVHGGDYYGPRGMLGLKGYPTLVQSSPGLARRGGCSPALGTVGRADRRALPRNNPDASSTGLKAPAWLETISSDGTQPNPIK